MSNLLNNNRKIVSLNIDSSSYYDFFLYMGKIQGEIDNSASLTEKCLISYIDTSDINCVSGSQWVYGNKNYTYSGAVTSTYSLKNIGYMGVDDGLYRFRKDNVTNREFLDIFTGSTYAITSGDTLLKLHQISGNTTLYEYPSYFNGKEIVLNGGFYQGFFETEKNKYKILPTKICDGTEWNFEFELKKSDLKAESEKTLNYKYPENKGIFFYIGTRSENKWITLYNSEDEAPDSGCNKYITDSYTYDEYDRKNNEYHNLGDYFLNDIPHPYAIDGYMTTNHTEDECFSGTVYHTMIYSPYINTDSCNCNYSQENDEIVNNETSAITVSLSGIPLDAYIYDITRHDNSKSIIETKVLSAQNDYFLDDGYEEVIKCGDCHNYLGEDGYFDSGVDISDFSYITNDGYDIEKTGYYEINTDNGFLIYDRTKEGYTVNTWNRGDTLTLYGKKRKYKGNLFIYMNRTCTGYTTDNADELLINNEKNYDYQKDLYKNAFCLQIKDDGSIGYKYLVKDCDAESGSEKTYKILSGYSTDGLIKNDIWYNIVVKIKAIFNKIRLYFYVNGRLKYISSLLPQFDFKQLDEIYEKQEGVPFNLSIGGGSQGLCDMIMENYTKLYNDKVYPIEENFGGTFIGYFRKFRFYNCKLSFNEINNNLLYDETQLI